MQPAVHFVLSFAIGALLLRDTKRPLLYGLVVGAIGILPDIDHVFVPAGFAESWMHSGYALVLAPLMVLVGAFVFDIAVPERRRKALPFALAAMAVLSGHLALDIAAGNMLPLAYPVEVGLFHADDVLLLGADGTPVLSAGDAALVCWAFFVAIMYAISIRRTGAEADIPDWDDIDGGTAEPSRTPLRISASRRVPV